MALRRDTALRLRNEVPGTVLTGIREEFNLGEAPNATEAIRLILDCTAAGQRVEDVLREYAGRCSVVWLVPNAASGLGIDFDRAKGNLTERYGEAELAEGRGIEPTEHPELLWAEDREGHTFIRLVEKISERYQQAGLDLVPVPVIGTYSMVLKPQPGVIEVRAPWTHFQSVLHWAIEQLGLDAQSLAFVDVRGDAQANALQQELDAKLKRARHKYDVDHDYDTVEVTPNQSRNDGDLSQATTYQQELAAIPGRGKYLSFSARGLDGEHLIQVAQTNFAVVFRSGATERLVTHVLNAALARGDRTPV